MVVALCAHRIEVVAEPTTSMARFDYNRLAARLASSLRSLLASVT